MTINEPLFESTIQTTREWLDDFQQALREDNRRHSYLIVRTVLHALRDSLSVAEAADLAAQLPMLMRGFYYEGYRPEGRKQHISSHEAFIEKVQAEFPDAVSYDAADAVTRVFHVLQQHISGDLGKHIAANLSPDVRTLWEHPHEPGEATA